MIRVEKILDSLVDDRALTAEGPFGNAMNGMSYQQDAIASHNGYQYITYYSANRYVCVARRQLPQDKWEIITLKDYCFNGPKRDDNHNTISMGICPNDGTIHLSFDHHCCPLHYRVSIKGLATKPQEFEWKSYLFGAVRNELDGQKIVISYPRFWQTPEGNLQFCYRRGSSGQGDRMLIDYDPQTGHWINHHAIDSGVGYYNDNEVSHHRCSYPNGYNYGPTGRLHTSWVWREHYSGANHDLIYVYSDNQGKDWYNGAGELLDHIPYVNSPGVVGVEISRGLGLMNTHGQAVDSKDRLHTVMWHSTNKTLAEIGAQTWEYIWGPAGARRYHHYWRDEKGDWQHTELPMVAGNRSKIFIDRDDNVIMIYRDNDFFEQSGKLVIAAASSAKNWQDWQTIYEDEGPYINEMLGDLYRWKEEGILSILVQGATDTPCTPTPLRILDFKISSN